MSSSDRIRIRSESNFMATAELCVNAILSNRLGKVSGLLLAVQVVLVHFTSSMVHGQNVLLLNQRGHESWSISIAEDFVDR